MTAVIANMNWTKENVWEFVKFYTLKKTKNQRILIPAFVVCMALLVVTGIITYGITKAPSVLIMAGLMLILTLGYCVCFYLIIRGMAKKLLAANAENGEIEIMFIDKAVIVSKNDEPIGMISWDDVAEYSQGPNALYITSKNDALLIIEDKSIKEGSREALIKLLDEKNVKKG